MSKKENKFWGCNIQGIELKITNLLEIVVLASDHKSTSFEEMQMFWSGNF